MELSPEEFERIEQAVDASFKRVHGYTYRGNDVPSHQEKMRHEERNGDSSHAPDTWQKIKHDFPSLFGKDEA